MLTAQLINAVPIIEKIEANGYHAFFVGGAVRDYLLKRPIHDIDIATSAPVEELSSFFEYVIPVGLEHGTVIVRHEGGSYEITTFRGGHFPDVMQSLQEDLRLRDFTMNAIAMDKTGVIYDFFNGQTDINDKVIRAVDDPKARLEEDPLRTLRAMRFVSELSFSIEQTTLDMMITLQSALTEVATERLLQEWIKMIQGNCFSDAIGEMKKTNILAYLPVFKHHSKMVDKLLEQNTSFASFGSFVAYFHYEEPLISIPTWIKEWKASNQMKKEAIALYEAIIYYEKHDVDAMLLYQLDLAYIPTFTTLLRKLFSVQHITETSLRRRKAQLPIQSRQDVQVTGHDLIQCFPSFQKGSWIRLTIEKIEREILLGKLANDKNEIKEWILCHPPDID